MRELQTVLALACCAWVLGCVFDSYNTAVRWVKWLRRLRGGLDLLFWVFAAAVVFATLFAVDDGRMRLYTLPILLLSWLLYRALLHRRVVAWASRSINAVQRLVRVVRWCLWLSIGWPLLQLARLVVGLGWLLYRGLCLLEDALFATLGVMFRLLCLLFRGFEPPTRDLRKNLRQRQEGIWAQASNWLLTASLPWTSLWRGRSGRTR